MECSPLVSLLNVPTHSSKPFHRLLSLPSLAATSCVFIAICKRQLNFRRFIPLMGTLNSNTVIGTLAVDGWAVTFGTARGAGQSDAQPSPLLAVPNVTAHPSTASVPTSYYSMWHYNYRR